MLIVSAETDLSEEEEMFLRTIQEEPKNSKD